MASVMFITIRENQPSKLRARKRTRQIKNDTTARAPIGIEPNIIFISSIPSARLSVSKYRGLQWRGLLHLLRLSAYRTQHWKTLSLHQNDIIRCGSVSVYWIDLGSFYDLFN
jgi:hypothetical protein